MPILAAALLISIWPFKHHEKVTSRYLVPAWHVDAARDKFTHRVICRLYQGEPRRPAVTFERDALAFAFPPTHDTQDAEFQVDGGPIRRWTSVYPKLVGAGATLSGTSMRNPTQGFVLLPLSVLSDAISVTIRARPDDRPRTFSIGGFRDALASAKRLGCDLDYGFVRGRI